ncbi:MAG: hypothetical protein WD894_15535 [Pirellulales bacterium]
MPDMPTSETSSDERPPPPQFTLRGALAAYSVIGVILSIPLIGLGFTLTAGILVALFVLQLPLFLLFGAFRPVAIQPRELDEWDRCREDRTG